LQWRRRRFVIAVLGTALVMALTLLLTGFQKNFDVEVAHARSLIRADGYIVQKGRFGPFQGASPIPTSAARLAANIPGVKQISPVIMSLQVSDRTKHSDIYVVGAEPGAMGAPTPKAGHAPVNDGEAVVDTRAGVKLGDAYAIGGVPFRVVGLTSHQTVLGGRPTAFITLRDAQRVLFGGQDFVTAVAVQGTPTSVPDGAAFVTADAAGRDLKRPLADTIESISMFRSLLWLVATAIVGSVVYLSALERVGDFAVFKATGTATADLLGALMLQAVVLAVSSSVFAIGLAYILRSQFPVTPLLPASIQVMMPVVALVIGLVASGAALRRAVTVDPALAFGGH
jgi:putative ABC transport system permease protein